MLDFIWKGSAELKITGIQAKFKMKYRCLWNSNAPFPNMTFDLDLWPTDMKINRDHLVIKDYLPTKFEALRAKPSWVISCTMLRETDIPTDRWTDGPTCVTPFSKGGGGINIWIRWESNHWLSNRTSRPLDLIQGQCILIRQYIFVDAWLNIELWGQTFSY